MNDLQNCIVPMGKEFNGVRRKVSVDKNFAIAGGAMILTSVAVYISAGAMHGEGSIWTFKGRYESLTLFVILDGIIGIGALTILLGIHVSYEGMPIGNHAFIDTSGTGIKFTKKF